MNKCKNTNTSSSSFQIQLFLNKRGSLRELSDEKFEHEVLPRMAEELSTMEMEQIAPTYSDEELRKDWRNLVTWRNHHQSGNHMKSKINSTSRIGMKLCEHFFPNFYSIETNKGISFESLWRDPQFLQKVLVWNRKSHSTPYLSELRRGVYFCGGLPKSTMFRPQLSKLISLHNGGKGQVVFDPCAGWGGRLLGTVSNECHYVGFEPNTETYENLNRLVDFLGIRKFVTLFNDDALNMENYEEHDIGNKKGSSECDILLTSPPYFDLEIYNVKEETQSVNTTNMHNITYKEWEQTFLFPLVKKSCARLTKGGSSFWNVAMIRGKHDMWESIRTAHREIGYTEEKDTVYEVVSSSRPTSKVKKKTSDRTIKFVVG